MYCDGFVSLSKLDGSSGLKGWSAVNVHVPSSLPVKSSRPGPQMDATPAFTEWFPVVNVTSSRKSHHVSICTLLEAEPHVRLGKT